MNFEYKKCIVKLVSDHIKISQILCRSQFIEMIVPQTIIHWGHWTFLNVTNWSIIQCYNVELKSIIS